MLKKVSKIFTLLFLPVILFLAFTDSLSDVSCFVNKPAAAVLCSQITDAEDHALSKNNVLQNLDVFPEKTSFQFFPSNSNYGTSNIISYSSQIIVISCADRAPPAVS